MDAKLVGVKKGFWKGRDLPFPILLDDDRQTEKAYTVASWPTTILIDPEGNVVSDQGFGLLGSKLPPLPPGVRAAHALNKSVAYGHNGLSLRQLQQFAGAHGEVDVKLDEAALKAKKIDPEAAIPITLAGTVTLKSWLELTLAADGLMVKRDGNVLLVTAGEPLPPSKPQTECAERLAGVLKKPKAFEMPATTLEGLCQYFERITGENFVLDPAARRAKALDPGATLPPAAGGGPLGASLAAILDPLGLEVVPHCEVFVVRPKAK